MKNNKPKSTSFTPCWGAWRFWDLWDTKRMGPLRAKPCRWGSGAGRCGGIEGAVEEQPCLPCSTLTAQHTPFCHICGGNAPPSGTGNLTYWHHTHTWGSVIARWWQGFFTCEQNWLFLEKGKMLSSVCWLRSYYFAPPHATQGPGGIGYHA